MATPSPDVRVAHLQRGGAKQNQCANRRDADTFERGARAVQAPWSGLTAGLLEVVCSDHRGRRGSAGARAQSAFGRGRMSDQELSDWKPIGSAARSLVAEVAGRIGEACRAKGRERRWTDAPSADAEIADAGRSSDRTTGRRAQG